MGNYQYKSGTWADVPAKAVPQDDSGVVLVVYPQATDHDGTGAPCSAIGGKRIEIRAPVMFADGLDWYQDFFSAEASESASVTGLTALNPRNGTWEKYSGTMWRPQIGGVNYFGATVVYTDVLIIIEPITSTV
jgi:hypothetical protein